LATSLRFGSPQYVKREADTQIDEIMSHHGAALVHGPRMIGKSSLLHQVSFRERSRGNTVIWLDLLGHGGSETASELLQGIGFTVAAALGKDWASSGVPPGPRIHDYLRRACDALPLDGRLILLVDEYDVLNVGNQDKLRVLDFIRSLLADPQLDPLRCVLSGFRPPSMFPVNELAEVSAWHSLFQMVRLPYFSAKEVREFLTWLGCGSDLEVENLTAATGGHPAIVAAAANEFTKGRQLLEIIKEALHLKGPVADATLKIVSGATGRLTASKEQLAAAIEGREVTDVELLLTLYLFGFTQPTLETRPVFAGTLFREAARSLAGLR